MKILRFHFVFFNVKMLEAEVKLENGDVVYPNIWLPDKNGVMIGRDHPFYGAEDVYNAPLQQVISHDESSEDDFRYVMAEFFEERTEEMSVDVALECLAIKDGADLVQYENGNYGFVAFYNGRQNGFEIIG